jgi:ribose transport system permease protein
MNRLLTVPLETWRRLSSGGPGLSRLLGVALMVLLLYGSLMAMDENARSLRNHQTMAGRLAFYGLTAVGVGVLIISGGIDLSIGSVIALGGVGFSLMLQRRVPPELAAMAVIAGSAAIGLCHGLLVTKLRLQPFLVTLCGLFIYRGLARGLAPTDVGLTVDGASEAFQRHVNGFHDWLVGKVYGVPDQLILFLFLALVIGLFLHGTRYGRYLFAIGANEEAARYAGVAVDFYKILAYVLCSAMAGLASVVNLVEARTVTASSAGTLLELYAITGAVLGGCSLRGGEGSAAGMVLGAAVLPLLRQLCIFGGISGDIEYAVIGAALLIGTIIDELLKRRPARRA